MAETENLKFPSVLDYVKNLSSIEERMVSPYNPFMQIKALQPYAINSQLSLKGSVVNINTDINEMVQVLPRKFDDLSVIQIKLKRHIEHISDYMYETIKPSKVCKALKYLRDTPLYLEHKIHIDNNFFNNYEYDNEDLDFVVDEEDLRNIENTYNLNSLKELNNLKSSHNNIIDTYKLNDDVLLYDNNDYSNNSIQPIILAPGQDKQPLPWHKVSNIDKLCFPKIFGGHHIDKLNKLTYAERILSEVRRRDRRSCEPTRLLFMAKQNWKNQFTLI
ncbi:hypothetical protein TKK_0014667 [Trichogramma kaykai]|uniref:DUF6570 domain-containing protein n=1 Tax=Trichogramma kaykai TaxID=54128 RepID=A0ABD2WEE1_9HYME